MKPFILSAACIGVLLCSISGAAQPVTWQHVGTIPVTDPLSDKLFGGLNGTIFLSNGYRSDDLGETWTPISFAPRDAAIAPDGALLFATENGIRRSTDNGETWEQLSPDVQDRVIDNIMVMTPAIWIARGERSFFRSEDGGESWIYTGEVTAEYITGVGAADVGTIMCAAQYPIDFGSGDEENDSTGVYRSTDGGQTWEQTTFTPDLITDGKLMVMRSMAVGGNGTILVGIQKLEGQGGIYRSTDRGESWSTTTLQDVVTNIVRAPEGTWFASAANSGVYRSTDDGRTWASINSGLLDVRIFPLGLNSDGFLFAADVFSNFYRTTAPVVASSSAPEERDRVSVSLFPNPAVDRTGLSFRSVQPGRFHVTATDPAGRHVRTLLDEELVAGEHAIDLELIDMPSGAYHIRIESPDGTVTLPLILVH